MSRVRRAAVPSGIAIGVAVLVLREHKPPKTVLPLLHLHGLSSGDFVRGQLVEQPKAVAA